MAAEENILPSNRIYCPINFVNREDMNGNIIEGIWRRDIYRGPITEIGRLGSNNAAVRADAQRNILTDYYCSDIGQVTWQWERALRRQYENPR